MMLSTRLKQEQLRNYFAYEELGSILKNCRDEETREMLIRRREELLERCEIIKNLLNK